MGQGGDDTQHHSVPQLEWQHGVHGEDDEEEKRHLEILRLGVYRKSSAMPGLIPNSTNVESIQSF